jgi:hypothetical protein
MFLSRKVVTTSLPTIRVFGLVISTFALPRTGATSFCAAAIPPDTATAATTATS